VHSSIEEEFLKTLRDEIERCQYSLGNDNYAQIITEGHFDRLIKLIDPDKIFIGGKHDRSKRLIEPTVLMNVTIDDAVMDDEIFGPILPVMTYNNIDEVIALIKSRPKPLSLYLFSESASLRRKILHEVSFGGGMTNDALTHFVNDAIPFGGVGSSGIGNYHGEAGFRAFSHYKSFIQKPTWFELPLKYFPYNSWKLAMIKQVIGY
jgi:aldehyde dehydrogenase (NAD+)